MKGVIYQIKTADGLYVGSTTEFNKRKSAHKKHIIDCPDRLVYKNIISNNGIYKIEIYCNVNCRDRRHLEFFEEQYRIILGANLNMIKSFRTDDEFKNRAKIYYDNNKEERKKASNEYRKKNIEKISAKNSVKYNCECGGKYTYHHKNRHFKSQKHLKYIKDSQTHPPP